MAMVRQVDGHPLRRSLPLRGRGRVGIPLSHRRPPDRNALTRERYHLGSGPVGEESVILVRGCPTHPPGF